MAIPAMTLAWSWGECLGQEIIELPVGRLGLQPIQLSVLQASHNALSHLQRPAHLPAVVIGDGYRVGEEHPSARDAIPEPSENVERLAVREQLSAPGVALLGGERIAAA
jgi:hypothetical protein